MIKKILLFVVATSIVCSAAGYFFLFTTPGGSLSVKWAISKFSKAEKVEFEYARGSIIKGFVLKNVFVRGLQGMPRDSAATVRQIDIRFERLSIEGLRILVSGGSLILPTSESILFYGNYSAGQFDFNIYSKSAGVDSLMILLGPRRSSAALKGTVANIDLLLKGSIREFALKGTAVGQRLENKRISLTDAPFVLDLVFHNKPENIRADGIVIVKHGRISGHNTAMVELNESKLIFSGDLSNPRLDIKGRSTVEQTGIRIFVSGTMEKPDLKLFSDPPMPQEQLLVMLATDKRWSGAEAAFSRGGISPDLALDFFDYFVLGGAGSKMARKFGITGLSVIYDGAKKGVGVKGAVTDRAEVGYGIVRTENGRETPEITQKLSGELKVTDTVSVAGEREYKRTTVSEGSAGSQATNDTVMIKFKKSF